MHTSKLVRRMTLRLSAALACGATLSCAPRDCIHNGMPSSQMTSVAAEPEKPVEGLVTAKDGRLWLDGKRFRFVGVNIYSLASVPANEDGFHCGRGFTEGQITQVLGEVAAMGANVVRVQAYQSHTEGGSDFRRTDFIVRTAEELGLKIVFTLENQWDDCTEGGYKYSSWYKARFRKPYGRYRHSYKDYVRAFAHHYRDRPGVLMYQLMNESESVSSNDFPDPEALLDFAREMAATVKKADPGHLLSFGTSGVLKPGSGGPFFALLHLVEGIDVVEAHDYNSDRQSMPEVIRLARMTARQIGKPFFIGETGISSPPMSKAHRAHFLKRKMEAAWEDDADGVLLWSYRSGDGGNKDFGPKDPLIWNIRRFTKVKGIAPKP